MNQTSGFAAFPVASAAAAVAAEDAAAAEVAAAEELEPPHPASRVADIAEAVRILKIFFEFTIISSLVI